MGNHPQPEQKRNAGGAQVKMPGPPPKEPRFSIHVAFREKGKPQMDKEAHGFEIRDTCLVIQIWDRFDKKGQPHSNWIVIPNDEIKQYNIQEIDRPPIVEPSGIIHPGTGRPAN